MWCGWWCGLVCDGDVYVVFFLELELEWIVFCCRIIFVGNRKKEIVFGWIEEGWGFEGLGGFEGCC